MTDPSFLYPILLCQCGSREFYICDKAIENYYTLAMLLPWKSAIICPCGQIRVPGPPGAGGLPYSVWNKVDNDSFDLSQLSWFRQQPFLSHVKYYIDVPISLLDMMVSA